MFVRVEVFKDGQVQATERFDLSVGQLTAYAVLVLLRGCLSRCGLLK